MQYPELDPLIYNQLYLNWTLKPKAIKIVEETIKKKLFTLIKEKKLESTPQAWLAKGKLIIAVYQN